MKSHEQPDGSPIPSSSTSASKPKAGSSYTPLVSSALANGKSTRQSWHASSATPQAENAQTLRRSGIDFRHGSPAGDKGKNVKRRSGGFLLGHTFGSTDPRSSGIPQGRRENIQRRLGHANDQHVSLTPSPQSSRSWKSQGKIPIMDNDADMVSESGRQGTMNGTRSYRHYDTASIPSERSSASDRSEPLDPVQLINMALTLNEGRRRAASGVSSLPKAQSARRIVSQDSRRLSVAPGSPLANDTVKDAAIRRQSRMGSLSPELLSKSPPMSKDSEVLQESPETADVSYDFSVSTLQRAERARRYFEMCHQYRRLLDSLPPLKPDGTAPGNMIIRTKSMPGSTHHEIERIPTNANAQHVLGREYNPLQYLRNVQLREELNEQLPSLQEGTPVLDAVEGYVGLVESASSSPDFRSDPDIVRMPEWPRSGRDEGTKEITGHARSNTASSKVLYYSSRWSFTPLELIADTVWSELPEHKSLLVNRRGQRIFPDLKLESPIPPKQNRDKSTTWNSLASAPGDPRGRQKRKFLSMHRTDSEGRRRPRWRRTRSASSSRASSRSSISVLAGYGNADGINIGPLVRHMERQMQQAENEMSPEPIAVDQWDELPKGDPASATQANGYGNQRKQSKRISKPLPLDLRKSKSFTVNDSNDQQMGLAAGTIDFRDGLKDDMLIRSAIEPGSLHPLSAKSYQSSQISPGNTAMSAMPQHGFPSLTSANDFAHADRFVRENTQENVATRLSHRSSIESVESLSMSRHNTNSSITSVAGEKRRDMAETKRAGRTHVSSVSRVLKGSRIVDLVRPDVRRKEETLDRLASETPIDGSLVEGKTTALNSDEEAIQRPTIFSGPRNSSENTRYHLNLPSFRFPEAKDRVSMSMTEGDPISRQQRTRKEQSLFSRPSKTPSLKIDVPDDDQSLKGGAESNDASRIFGLLSPIKRLRSSTNPSRSNSYRQPESNRTSRSNLANEVMPSDNMNMDASQARRRRQWSIANQLDRPHITTTDTITFRDIERVRALFLSSGIKAHTLRCRADSIPDKPNDLLTAAAQASNKDISTVSQKDRIDLAGQIYSRLITTLQSESSAQLKHFRDVESHSNRNKLDHLRYLAGEDITTQVQVMSDEAEGFATDLTTHQTLAVKSVHDAIDRLMRVRRRKFRWLRRIGFAGLEYLLLAIMWGVWLLFVVVKIMKGTVFGAFRIVFWLFGL